MAIKKGTKKTAKSKAEDGVEEQDSGSDISNEQDGVHDREESMHAEESNEPAAPVVETLNCPKCGTKYEKGTKMQKGIVHIQGDSKDVYCEPCASSWLQRSGAKLV